DVLLTANIRDRAVLATKYETHQYPAFAYRIIVDIASKALSPAINDPTTAVIAIDHLQHLLTEVAHRELADDGVGDATGQRRLVVRTPDWDDYLSLAATEIRLYGGSSIQVVRRLRAMLESLVETLPPGRAGSRAGLRPLLATSARRSPSRNRIPRAPSSARSASATCGPEGENPGTGASRAPATNETARTTATRLPASRA